MKQAQDLGSPSGSSASALEVTRPSLRESGIVPARKRNQGVENLAPALLLQPPRDTVSEFGTTLSGAHDLLLVGGRIDEAHPFGALYRRTRDGLVRERLMRGAPGRRGPLLATDGVRVLMAQPASEPAQGNGLAAVYRRTHGQDEAQVTQLRVEAQLEPPRFDEQANRFGERAALGNDLLVLGHSASLGVYRHSAVGWLSTGQLKPRAPYGWNPVLGQGLAVVRNRVLVGNAIELDGHRAGPGRVFVYRSMGDHMQFERELTGQGIEFGRDETPALGFGASIHVANDLVAISAPHELASDGSASSAVYVYRAHGGELGEPVRVEVPGLRDACIAGDRLFCLGAALHVFARRGDDYVPLGEYESGSATTLSTCGPLLALGTPTGAGSVAVYFVAQF